MDTDRLDLKGIVSVVEDLAKSLDQANESKEISLEKARTAFRDVLLCGTEEQGNKNSSL